MIGRRRRSLHEELLEQKARSAPDAETAEQRLAKLTRKPIVLGALAAVAFVILKIVAKLAGIELIHHPSWTLAAVFVIAVGTWIAIARARRAGADDE